MTTEPQVEQGTHSQLDNSEFEQNQLQEENLNAAIEAIQEQADQYKDAGLTQVSAWLE